MFVKPPPLLAKTISRERKTHVMESHYQSEKRYKSRDHNIHHQIFPPVLGYRESF